MIRFGGKAFVQVAARTALYSLNAVFIGVILGPVALAIFSRQRALVIQVGTLVKHYAQVFAPTASTLDARSDRQGLQQLLLQTSRYGMFIALPMMVLLACSGDVLVKFWMGPDYVASAVLLVLVAGHVLVTPLQSAFMVLMGTDRHGRAALLEVFALLGSVVLIPPFLLWWDGGLLGAALAVAVPLALFIGLLLPWYACRELGVPVADLLRAVSIEPVLAVVPLALLLLGARWMWPQSPGRSFMLGFGAGGIVTGLIYWRYALPLSIKQRLARWLPLLSVRQPGPTGGSSA